MNSIRTEGRGRSIDKSVQKKQNMSHFEEEPGGLDANENMSAEENGGTERTSLMVDKEVRSPHF